MFVMSGVRIHRNLDEFPGGSKGPPMCRRIFMWDPASSEKERQGDDPRRHTAVHEFVVKLARIKERLYTAEGRRIAEDRHRYMIAFFDRLDAEVRGEL